MPIFDNTVQQVITVSQDDLAPISALAGIVLQDPSLTARVLKLANSVHYNPTLSSVSTVTRAIIVLGFNAVRNMCLTFSLVDDLAAGSTRERFARELARSMHAATQARALAEARGDKSPEEVFIATLFYRIGELAFWCFGGELGDQLERLMNQPGMIPEQAQEKLLGFRLSHLSRQLAREWHLSDLLQKAVTQPGQKEDRIQTVLLGQQIARCAVDKGWRSSDMDGLIRKSALIIERSFDDTRALLFQKAQDATTLTTDFGARFAAVHIPQPNLHSLDETAPAEAAAQTPELPPAEPAAPGYPPADDMLQIKILREMATLIEEGQCDFNLIMELVLEGIYRGVGMDRVLFALLTPDKQALKAKYALGEDHLQLSGGFYFSRTPSGQPNILFETIDRKLPHWITDEERRAHASLIPAKLTQTIGPVPFMVAPIIVNNQCIGVFYADRGLSHRPLDKTIFDGFKHFVQQANMGLTLIASRARRKG